MATVEFVVKGPLFNGKADAAIEAFLLAAKEKIAQQGVDDVHNVLDSVLQNPTGNYERHIRTERQQNDLAVTDTGIVYGSWLEGVSSRNQSTKFKGYNTFRKATQTLNAKALSLAKAELVRFLEKMN